MSTIKLFTGFTKIVDEKSGKSIAKCNICCTSIDEPNLLKAHISTCKGSSTSITVLKHTGLHSPPKMNPKSISEKIINFFDSCSIPPDIIEHPSAIEMFQTLQPNIQLPSLAELSKTSKLVRRQIIEEPSNALIPSPPEESQIKIEGDEDKTTFAELKQYIDEYSLSNSQAVGLLQLLNVPFASEIFPEFPADMEANEPGSVCVLDPLVDYGTDEEVEEEGEAEEENAEPWDNLISESSDHSEMEYEIEPRVLKLPMPLRGVLNWDGFSKVHDLVLGRNVAQCDACLQIIKNTSRIEAHRKKCMKRDSETDDKYQEDILPPSESTGRRPRGPDTWIGFSKVYDEKLWRNVAQCNACGKSVKNTTQSRLNSHRQKCHFEAVDSDRRSTGNQDDVAVSDEWITLGHQQETLSQAGSTPTESSSQCEDISEIVEHQPNTSKKHKRALNWEGFTKIFDERLERNVAQCSKCGEFVKNTSRIDHHRLRCHGSDTKAVPVLRSGLDWNGFLKVYSKSMKRNVAQCESCGAVVMNTTRMSAHWKKCPRNKNE